MSRVPPFLVVSANIARRLESMGLCRCEYLRQSNDRRVKDWYLAPSWVVPLLRYYTGQRVSALHTAWAQETYLPAANLLDWRALRAWKRRPDLLAQLQLGADAGRLEAELRRGPSRPA